MIYYTGDIHGQKYGIISFCYENKLTQKDTIVILGDVGANYYVDIRDESLKRIFSKLLPTILCIHGNHEQRPHTISSYKTKVWNEGLIWYEEEFPNILFAKDGEIYNIEGLKHIAIGGAYSVDKFYRLQTGNKWWADEQPSEEIKTYVEEQISKNSIDIVLSHTCPHKYEPIETFLPGIDQSTVDKSTELWLDKIEEQLSYKAWFCGHWHINKRIDKMHFLYYDFESNEQFKENYNG